MEFLEHDDSEISDEEWMRWVAYLVFLDEEEDIYTLEDGEPYTPSS